MKSIRITKIFSFEAAHALKNYNGHCKNIHGHSYKLHVTIKGNIVAEDGMLIDFGDLKHLVQKALISTYDHSLILKDDDQMVLSGIGSITRNLIVLPFNPTSENLIINFAEIISDVLPENISLHHLKLYETETSFTEWYAEDNMINSEIYKKTS
jgi:6-pyruvoyltetrahydropterin/6-carboxytetrahydropterin synthase